MAEDGWETGNDESGLHLSQPRAPVNPASHDPVHAKPPLRTPTQHFQSFSVCNWGVRRM